MARSCGGDDLKTRTRHELADVALILGDCLERLDRVGAGIAAIHVNAAIEHLAELCPGSIKRPAGVEGECDWIAQDSDDAEPGISQREIELLARLDTSARPH